MGTKRNPGQWDCYANAEPDEPMFVLLARDERAPSTVIDWVLRRAGLISLVVPPPQDTNTVRFLLAGAGKFDKKAEEALDCADAMKRWRAAR